MSTSSLKFGTSGLRGLAVDLVGSEARRYTAAFLAHLRASGKIGAGKVFIARDLRPSSPQITEDCAAAIRAAGLIPIDCGVLPTPALALYAMANNGPAIMVTGSHIPADRNGLKFYTPNGEIAKADEAGITESLAQASATDGVGQPVDEYAQTRALYMARYANLLPADALKGWRVGVFEHSTVAREVLGELIAGAGAEVVPLGRVEGFVAVDTEAFTDAVFEPLEGWRSDNRLDAIVSSDGDGDRPLLMDADSNFVRGDVLGLLAAQFVGADVVVTPVTSNSAIERTGLFGKVLRTRVGSPYVISGIEDAITGGAKSVVGFEANGGVLLGSDVQVNGTILGALPTRDAVLPLLAVLGLAAQQGKTIAELVAALPVRHALSNRLENVPQDRSAALLAALEDEGYATRFFAEIGPVATMSDIDGLQFTMQSGDMVHYRPSGNAPELRCYVEGSTPEQAEQLLDWAMHSAEQLVR